ncbi:MAG: hypothetical protein RBG13Loki_0903 [Promethearchaeota archaeon CR_4]|nr:MAG: hypothetical protein RBG13Loki_0903 [Candidatus Lokiarchaeota archaeon CR_4]
MELYKIVLSFVLAVLCLVLGLAIYLRKRQELLNRIFCGAFLSYTIFFTFDALIGLFYANLDLTNLWRDISSLAATTGHCFVFGSAIFIWKGKEMLFKRWFLIPFICITGIIGIVGQFHDEVKVDLGQQSYTLQHDWIGLAFAYLYGAALILVCIVIYFKIYAQSQNPEIKTRLMRLTTGLLIVIAGQVLQAVLMAALSETVYYRLIVPEAIVYTCWAIGILLAARALWK